MAGALFWGFDSQVSGLDLHLDPPPSAPTAAARCVVTLWTDSDGSVLTGWGSSCVCTFCVRTASVCDCHPVTACEGLATGSVWLPWGAQGTVLPRVRFLICFPSFIRRRRRRRSTRISSPLSQTQTAQTRTAMGLSQPARGPSTRGSPARLRRRRRRRSSIRRSPGTERGRGMGTVSTCCTPRAPSRAESTQPLLQGQGVSFS